MSSSKNSCGNSSNSSKSSNKKRFANSKQQQPAHTAAAEPSVENRISTLSSELTEQNELLSELDTRYESTKSRYMQQFSAMEAAVTSLKSTGEYLTNLFEAMNNDD